MSNHRLSRREMLMLVGAAAIRPAYAETSLLRPRRIDHVSLAVADIDRAMIFYRRLFGNEVRKENKTSRRYIRLGPGYASIAPAASGQPVRIDHYCAGIDDFQGNALKSRLASAGTPVRGSDSALFVTDPDGTNLQLMADGSWTHLGSNAASEPGPSGEPLFRARSMHHLAIRISNMERSTEFYRKLFGPEVRHQGNPPQPWFQAGETAIGLYYPVAGKDPGIDHFCVLVDRFDPASALRELKALGAKAELSGNGTLPEFYDPQGIRLQVTTAAPANNS